MLEKTLESPLNCKVSQQVHPKGDQSWVFIGKTDAEAETPILWPPDAKSWLIWKDPDAGKDWGQEEKGTTEDEMAGWQHITDTVDMGLGRLRQLLMDREAWRPAVHRVAKSQTRLSQTELNLDSKQGSAFFFKETDSKYFRLCRSFKFRSWLLNSSTVLQTYLQIILQWMSMTMCQ